MTKEHLFLRALKGENVERPPVWMMRQAGRYLPEYIAIRKKYDFFTRVETPELAAEITIQPVDIIGVDAAILFSDILVIPKAMGMEVQLVEKVGPVLPEPIIDARGINKLINVDDALNNLTHVFDAIKLTKKELNGRVPLIGFAGAPFTLLCYMIQGSGSKTFDKAKQFCFANQTLAHSLLQKITDLTISYLKMQVRSGADAVQIFDSWSGLLSPIDFKIFSQPYLTQIADALYDETPVILFPKGSWYALNDLSKTKINALGIDWSLSPKLARELTGGEMILQGNFDPCKLLMPPLEIEKQVHEMIDAFGPQKYIANLGHGILPNIPVENAKAFVNAVKNYKK
jgi:uroporphyrinogen decarboxylase